MLGLDPREGRRKAGAAHPRSPVGLRCPGPPVVPRGSRVMVNPRRRGGLVGETGQVVGPDQRWFPHPHSVWVEFGNGLTILIAVTDLIIMPVDGDCCVG